MVWLRGVVRAAAPLAPGRWGRVVPPPGAACLARAPPTLITTRDRSTKHKKFVKFAKGYRGRANRCFRIAIGRVEKAWQHAYKGRKLKKRRMRSLWITRINAGARQYGVPYNRFMPALRHCNIELNRKILSELAVTEPLSFRSVIDVAVANDPYLQNPPVRRMELTPEEFAALSEKIDIYDPNDDWDESIEMDEDLDDEDEEDDDDDDDDVAQPMRARSAR